MAKRILRSNVSRYATKSRLGRSKFGSTKNPIGAGFLKTDLSKISSLADETLEKWAPYEKVFGSSKPKQITQAVAPKASKAVAPKVAQTNVANNTVPITSSGPYIKQKPATPSVRLSNGGASNSKLSKVDIARMSTNANVDAAKKQFGTGGYTGYKNGSRPINKIDMNKGEGFFKTIWKNAEKIIDSDLGKSFDNATGVTSFVRGFGDAGQKFEGGVVSKAAQNAGYIKKNAAGEITNVDYKKIAAGYIGASAVARVATGGGLYKDGQGNTNVIGLPFI